MTDEEYNIWCDDIVNNFSPGDYVIDCSYHPGIIVHKDDAVQVHQLTTNQKAGCSLIHCGIEKIDFNKAIEMVEVWKSGGDRALAMQFGGWTKEQYDEFEKEWR